MKNGSKNGAKIEPKSIKKRGPKNDAKRVPKRAQPLGAGSPLEGSLLRREQYRKTTNKQKTTMIAESWRCSAEKVSRAQTGCQHASGACGPERISVAYGNVPAPGLGKLCALQR